MRPVVTLPFLVAVSLVNSRDLAVFHQDGALGDAGGHGEFDVALEVAEVAVDGDEELGLDEVDHHLELFLGAVSGDVDETVGTVVVDDDGVPPLEVVDDAVDGFFVTGDDARAHEDGVAGVDLGKLVVVDGGSAERAHGFALGAGDHDEDLVGGHVADLAGVDEQALGNLDVAEVLGDLGRVVHGAADDGDLASVLLGEFEGEAEPGDGGREAGEEEALLGLGEDLVETGAHGFLAGGPAAAIDVGRVLEEGEDASVLAEVGECLEIEGLAVRRREVDLEVTGVQDDADRGVDGECDAIDQRVGDPDGHDREGPEGEAFTGQHLDEVGVVEQAVFVELAFHERQGEFSAVDRHVELGEDPGQASDVIFVAVGEDDRLDLRAVLDEVGDIRHDDVHAEEFFFREHQAGVDDNNVVLPTEGHAVHTELAEAPQRNHA